MSDLSKVTLPNNVTYNLADSEARALIEDLSGDLENKAESAGANSNYAAKLTAAIPFGKLDSTSTATLMTATVPGITELKNGVCVFLYNGVITSASGFTININRLGAKPVYSSMAADTRITTTYNVAYTMLFVYNENRVSGGCWDMYYGYYTNTNTIGYQLRTNSSTLPAQAKFYRYRLLFTSADGKKWVPANTSSSTNATSSRTVNQTPIDPFGEIVYYGTTTAIEANASVTAAQLWQEYTLTLGYSFNRTNAALVLNYPAPVYIKCAPQSDGSAIIDADNPYVQALPTTDDGKIYIFLGRAYSATSIEMTMNHPVYYHDGTGIKLWTGLDISTLADVAFSGSYNDLQDTPMLAGVATSGSYNDLQNTPVIPTQTSDLVNNSGFISAESDPTVPSWAKASTKPTYTYDEVGAEQEAFVVYVTPIPDSDYYQLDKTYSEIVGAIISGRLVKLTDGDVVYPYTTAAALGQNSFLIFGATVTYGGYTLSSGYAVTNAGVAFKVDSATTTVESVNGYTGNVQLDAVDIGALGLELKGSENGVAELDANGHVPTSQLPSYVDDVLEYSSQSAFPATGETGKIYVDTSTNKTYRWSGSQYVEISPSLALGETSSTAYRGDRGKTAYDHAQAHGSAFSSGLYKITTNSEGHVTGATSVAKSDITGLGVPSQDTTYTFADGTNGFTVTPSGGSAQTVIVTPSISSIENDLTLLKTGTSPGDSYSLIFQRGTLTDNFNDWRIQDRGGFLYFDQRGSTSATWGNMASINTSGTITANTFSGTHSGTIASSTTATTQATTDNSTKVATTAFVKNALSGYLTLADLPIWDGGVT